MKSFHKTTILLGVGTAMAASSAMGAFTFTNGDLILGFQATGGVGSTKNVFFNLGAGTAARDNPTIGSLGNISTTLSSVFGANWYSRSDVYFGVIGNLRGNANSGFGSAAAVNGDPSRTFYLSTATVNVGEGTLIAASAYPGSALGSAATSLGGTETMIVGLNTESDGAAILDQATQPVEWANGWTTWNPTPGAAYGVFTGGIQQSFGQTGASTYADIQRVLSTNTGATPTGVIGGGTYETTLAIGSNGGISLIPEPSSSLLAAVAGIALTFRRRRNA
jgi:hypothetical protein